MPSYNSDRFVFLTDYDTRVTSHRYCFTPEYKETHVSEIVSLSPAYTVKITVSVNNIPNVVSVTVNDSEYKIPKEFKVVESDKVDVWIPVVYSKFANKVGFFGAFDIDTKNNKIITADLMAKKVIYKLSGFYYRGILENKNFLCGKLFLLHRTKDFIIIRPRIVELKSHITHEFDIRTYALKELIDNDDLKVFYNNREVKPIDYFDLPYIWLYDVTSDIPFSIEVCMNANKIICNVGIVLTYVLSDSHTHYTAMLGYVYNPQFTDQYLLEKYNDKVIQIPDDYELADILYKNLKFKADRGDENIP